MKRYSLTKKGIITTIIAVMVLSMCFPQFAHAGSRITDEDIAVARSAVTDAENLVAEKQALIDRGSVGFFESVNAERALAVLNYRMGAQESDSEWGKTEIGVTGDATSLDNMKASIDFIELGNQYRQGDDVNTDLQDLKISDAAMAAAQVRTNASAAVIGHSEWTITGGEWSSTFNASGIGENLSWGYANPFDGWYTEEKLVYDYIVANGGNVKDKTDIAEAVSYLRENGYPGLSVNSTGHYTNIISTTNNATGFATVNKTGTLYRVAHGQFFLRHNSSEPMFTVQEYRARFNSYYNSVYGELADAERTLEAAQSRLDDLIEQKAIQDIKDKLVLNGLTAVNSGKNKVNLTWDSVPDAEGYIIYGRRGDSGEFGYIGMTTKGETYTDTNALDTDYNYYRVYPYVMYNGKRVVGTCKQYAYAKGITTAPTGITASGAGKGVVQIKWNPVPGADGYLIYGRHSKTGTYGYITMTTGATTAKDMNALDNDYNFYWVYPYHMKNGNRVIGSTPQYVYAKGVTGPVTKANGLAASSVSGGVKISWKGVKDAAGYIIYARRPGASSFSYIGMTTQNLYYIDKSASKSDWTFYRVFPFHYGIDNVKIVGESGDYVYGKAK